MILKTKTILIACEFSGIVREAFRAKGYNAISCDLLPTEKSGLHLQCDVKTILHWKWAAMIAFPPCKDIAVSGARWFKGKQKEQKDALDFVRTLMFCNIPKKAIENPVGKISTEIRKPDQIIQPWQYGHGETKATCLWLENLSLLKPSKIVEGREGRIWKESPSPDRWKNRSRTYSGIASAMAEQWGPLI